jgi:hypothetical protein
VISTYRIEPPDTVERVRHIFVIEDNAGDVLLFVKFFNNDKSRS